MNYTLLTYTSTHIYYEIGGKCYIIKHINTLNEREAKFVIKNTGLHVELTIDNCPADTWPPIAHKYLS